MKAMPDYGPFAATNVSKHFLIDQIKLSNVNIHRENMEQKQDGSDKIDRP